MKKLIGIIVIVVGIFSLAQGQERIEDKLSGIHTDQFISILDCVNRPYSNYRDCVEGNIII